MKIRAAIDRLEAEHSAEKSFDETTRNIAPLMYQTNVSSAASINSDASAPELSG